MTAAEPTTNGTYRDRLVAVEPGGNEFIAEADRHGRPSQLLWTWASPNLEFATIFLGVLAVSYFGMNFWQAAAGVIVGAGLGAVAHYFLSARGPQLGVPQMVLGRLPFGFRGNAVPSVLMAVTAGVGWFATNSVSGAFALSTLFGIGPLLGLVLVVAVQTALAFFGHNLVQAFERWAFPVLAVIFAITSVVIMAQADLGAPAVEGGVGGLGGFLLTVGTTFGYVAGWAPYAADFSRYLPSTTSPVRTGLFAAAGLFLACTILAIVGAASVTIVTAAASDNPTDAFTGSLPGWLAGATLLAITIGAVAANGVGPWLGVVFADQYLRRGHRVDGFLYDRSYSNLPGLLSFLIGLVVSVLLFCNQELFVGYLVRAVPELGDIGFFVGFVLAAGSYLVLCRSKIQAERVAL
ncbi:MAG: cytosine permease [Mycobacterium sp.]|nr:cytosine permease [Mycobacterium sp.]